MRNGVSIRIHCAVAAAATLIPIVPLLSRLTARRARIGDLDDSADQVGAGVRGADAAVRVRDRVDVDRAVVGQVDVDRARAISDLPDAPVLVRICSGRRAVRVRARKNRERRARRVVERSRDSRRSAQAEAVGGLIDTIAEGQRRAEIRDRLATPVAVAFAIASTASPPALLIAMSTVPVPSPIWLTPAPTIEAVAVALPAAFVAVAIAAMLTSPAAPFVIVSVTSPPTGSALLDLTGGAAVHDRERRVR